MSIKGTFFSKLVQSYNRSLSTQLRTGTGCIMHATPSSKVRNSLDIRGKDLTAGCLFQWTALHGTAHFDPRPAVVKFLEKKDRRNKFPAELYKDRQFVKKFFSDW